VAFWASLPPAVGGSRVGSVIPSRQIATWLGRSNALKFWARFFVGVLRTRGRRGGRSGVGGGAALGAISTSCLARGLEFALPIVAAVLGMGLEPTIGQQQLQRGDLIGPQALERARGAARHLVPCPG